MHKQLGQPVFRASAFLMSLFCLIQKSKTQTCHSQITIDYRAVSFTGKYAQTLPINGGIPGRTLSFSESYKAVIHGHDSALEVGAIGEGVLLIDNMQV